MTPPDDVSEREKAVEIICPHCMKHIGGAVAGNAVRWTLCDDCKEDADD